MSIPLRELIDRHAGGVRGQWEGSEVDKEGQGSVDGWMATNHFNSANFYIILTTHIYNHVFSTLASSSTSTINNNSHNI